LLQEHARRAGARVRCSTGFRGWRNGVVTLGNSSVRTRLLIGADGRRSAVARAVAAPHASLRPGRSCAWYGYWDRSPLTEIRTELSRRVIGVRDLPTYFRRAAGPGWRCRPPNARWRHPPMNEIIPGYAQRPA
jgi:2-polyprenyl-6-methoxyphenol hydroxylase-like FAD-dependent oxidoreductase